MITISESASTQSFEVYGHRGFEKTTFGVLQTGVQTAILESLRSQKMNTLFTTKYLNWVYLPTGVLSGASPSILCMSQHVPTKTKELPRAITSSSLTKYYGRAKIKF